jgi:cbb3-type cytochrome oxidase subunit 3
MTLPTLATVLVSLAFVGLCIWVLRPSNKARLERHGLIPFDDEAAPATRTRRGQPR